MYGDNLLTILTSPEPSNRIPTQSRPSLGIEQNIWQRFWVKERSEQRWRFPEMLWASWFYRNIKLANMEPSIQPQKWRKILTKSDRPVIRELSRANFRPSEMPIKQGAHRLDKMNSLKNRWNCFKTAMSQGLTGWQHQAHWQVSKNRDIIRDEDSDSGYQVNGCHADHAVFIIWPLTSLITTQTRHLSYNCSSGLWPHKTRIHDDSADIPENNCG